MRKHKIVREQITPYDGYVFGAYGHRTPCPECGLSSALHYPRGDRYREPRLGYYVLPMYNPLYERS